ncbi:GDP-mannose-dependent alpha-mannosyltransferase [Agaricicola taiwanensis]|uniref:GDP-mannose-dependent alpha-mannosyltransferase n=1 Tax=Agaricicola taiwanensis TaxID=591372 RepID=A0A8J3DUK8_9RHOB|nr:glycosyltransferase family 1 protein [Agaricicola taiwanensis]GGE43019.1 GDP-mannose-dependent alpha-mannosyltransferase [Agaricicola taiwanensis]
MRILIASDAWQPQINGVVRTLERLGQELPALGAQVDYLTPQDYRTLPMPTYPDIRMALTSPANVARRIAQHDPEHVHIATEGPLGIMARRACLASGRAFTTSYHTRFPEYLRARVPVPEAWTYAWLRRFHNDGSATLAATPTLVSDLRARGFDNVVLWSRGVDGDLFRPRDRRVLDLPGPIFLSVGRIAIEKNLEAFLSLDLPGSKVVVGDGPALAQLKARYPDTVFLGARTGEDLAAIYASADVFVFPSLTDTFGIVLLEALASGLPVAAYPVMGPIDVIGGTEAGVLDADLKTACLAALNLSREKARELALRHSWTACAQLFLDEARAAKFSRAVRQRGRILPRMTMRRYRTTDL